MFSLSGNFKSASFLYKNLKVNGVVISAIIVIVMSSGVLEIIVSLNIIISHITSIIEETNRYLMSLSIRIYDLSSFLGLSLLVSLFFLRVVFIGHKGYRLFSSFGEKRRWYNIVLC